jgi:replicative DNA helicase
MSAQSFGCVPPHDLSAEAAVMSAMLTDRRALDIVLSMMDPCELYSDANRRIFDVARTLHSTGTPVDVQTVASVLKDRDRLQAVGGVAYITSILDATPAVAHVEAHANIVKAKARVRRVIDACQRAAADGFGDYGDADMFCNRAEASVFEASRSTSDDDPSELGELMLEQERRMEAIERGEAHPLGVPFGFVRLDELLGGGAPGEVTVLAGRPGMGKTALGLNIAANVAESSTCGVRNRVLFQSIEMRKQKCSLRLAGARARVNTRRVATVKLSDRERVSVHNAHIELARLPMLIDDSSHITPTRLRGRIRRAQAKFDRDDERLALVVVDYLQFMRGDREHRDRAELVGENMQQLTHIAKEAEVHILVLAQLNRDVAKRSGKELRPRLSDLSESGKIEMHAHNVLFIHRPEYYLSEDEVPDDMKGVAELIVAKQRDGATGLVQLRYTDYCTRFDNALEV